MIYSDTDLAHRQSYMDAHGGSLEGYVALPRKARKPRNNEESRMQQALLKWWHMQHQAFKLPEQVLFAIPNGMRKGAIIGSILKREGVRAGAPDLMLAVQRSPIINNGRCGIPHYEKAYFCGLFLELKTPTGRVSPEQIAFHSALRSQGYRVEVVRTLEEGINLITTYLTQ